MLHRLMNKPRILVGEGNKSLFLAEVKSKGIHLSNQWACHLLWLQTPMLLWKEGKWKGKREETDLEWKQTRSKISAHICMGSIHLQALLIYNYTPVIHWGHG